MSAPLPPWATAPQGGAPLPDSPLDRQFAAFIGPHWPTYRRKFEPFFDDPRFQPTWNWSAALFTPMWFLYRKLYLPFAFFWFVPGVVFRALWSGNAPTLDAVRADPQLASDVMLVFLGVQLSSMLLAGGTANYLLYRRARAAFRLAQQGTLDAGALLRRLEQYGRVNRIGVLIVLAIVLAGMLATLGGGAR